MLEFMAFMLNLAWRALGVICGWLLLKYILKNGTGTLKEILDTITIGLRAMGHAIRKKLLGYLKREAEQEREPDVEVTVE